MRHTTIFALALTASLLPAAARADDLAGYAFGGRVGGYGFRQAPTAAHDAAGWNDCRMNGMGIFADKRIGRHFFAEAGLDFYFADAFPTGGHDHDGAALMESAPMDRSSTILSAAGGIRFWQESRLSPYLQVGLGLEYTHAAMPTYDLEGTYLLPLAFFGVGGDLRVYKTLRLGAVFRLHTMGHFDHDNGASAMDVEPEMAAQGQFYAKIAL